MFIFVWTLDLGYILTHETKIHASKLSKHVAKIISIDTIVDDEEDCEKDGDIDDTTDDIDTGDNDVTQDVSGYLDKAKGLGLRNILALRGDLPNIDEEWQVLHLYMHMYMHLHLHLHLHMYLHLHLILSSMILRSSTTARTW